MTQKHAKNARKGDKMTKNGLKMLENHIKHSIMTQNRDSDGIKFIEKHIEDRILKNLAKKDLKLQRKYRFILFLMMDCGLRVSEAIRLMTDDINFTDGKNGSVRVVSLKKRERNLRKVRTIPMTYRCLEAASEFWFRNLKSKERESGKFIFHPNKKNEKGDHLSRVSVWRMIKKLSHGEANPHMARHRFGTELIARGADLVTARDLMGHESTRTTEIYLHAKREKIEQAVDAIEIVSWKERIRRKFFPVRRNIHVVPVNNGLTKFHVGRKKEFDQLMDLIDKKVNVLLLGEQGTGKSHLLDNVRLEKAFRIDEVKSLKKTLVGILLELYEGKQQAEKERGVVPFNGGAKAEMLEALYQRKDVRKAIQLESTKNLVDLMIRITDRHEYTILVDDATTITASGVTVLEKMKNHFHFVIAARKIKYSQMSFVTNFEKIVLENLDRPEAIELISRASEKFGNRIENWEMYKNHIWRSSNGNPLFILEMVERFKKEGFVSEDMVSRVKHNAALKEIDMSIPLLIALSSLMVLRYYGREAGTDSGAFMLFGGGFMVFAIFARSLFNGGKRKYV